MYCPQCASPIDGVKFCRSCGANVSLVPQALTGQLPAATDQPSRPGRRTIIDTGFVTNFFAGIGFLIASIVISFYVPSGVFWGWSMLIPGFACFGEGIGGYMKYRYKLRQEETPTPHYGTQSFQPNKPMPQMSAPTTSELTSPSSITEDTTKHLETSRRRE
jgi:hypothetical protein